MIGRDNLSWRQAGKSLALHLGQSRKPILNVVPAAVHPCMWRVQYRGWLSDFANLTRAKDAGIAVALADLNQSREAA
jgi:hypothetical protein